MDDFLNLFYNYLIDKNQYTNGRQFHKYFEIFVLKLLENILFKENKPLIKYPKEEYLGSEYNVITMEFNAIAPEDIGPTLIEIKTSLSTKPIQNIARLYRHNEKEFNSYLIIIGSQLDNSDKIFLKNSINNNLLEKRNQIEIWDLEKIVELASNSDDISKRILNNIDNEVFNITIENTKKAMT